MVGDIENHWLKGLEGAGGEEGTYLVRKLHDESTFCALPPVVKSYALTED